MPDRPQFVFSRSTERTKECMRCRYTIHHLFIVSNHAVYDCIRQYSRATGSLPAVVQQDGSTKQTTLCDLWQNTIWNEYVSIHASCGTYFCIAIRAHAVPRQPGWLGVAGAVFIKLNTALLCRLNSTGSSPTWIEYPPIPQKAASIILNSRHKQ